MTRQSAHPPRDTALAATSRIRLPAGSCTSVPAPIPRSRQSSRRGFSRGTPSLSSSWIATLLTHSSRHREGDVALLRWVYKHAREFARRMPCYRGEVAGVHPLFPADSPAAPRSASGPVPIDAPDIAYTAEDDKAIEEYIRMNGRVFSSCIRCVRG